MQATEFKLAEIKPKTRRIWLKKPGLRWLRYVRYGLIAARNERRRTSGAIVSQTMEGFTLEIESTPQEDPVMPKSSDSSLGPLGKALTLYQELYHAGRVEIQTPEERQADLDEAIANSRAFENGLLTKFKVLSH